MCPINFEDHDECLKIASYLCECNKDLLCPRQLVSTYLCYSETKNVD